MTRNQTKGEVNVPIAALEDNANFFAILFGTSDVN